MVEVQWDCEYLGCQQERKNVKGRQGRSTDAGHIAWRKSIDVMTLGIPDNSTLSMNFVKNIQVTGAVVTVGFCKQTWRVWIGLTIFLLAAGWWDFKFCATPGSQLYLTNKAGLTSKLDLQRALIWGPCTTRIGSGMADCGARGHHGRNRHYNLFGQKERYWTRFRRSKRLIFVFREIVISRHRRFDPEENLKRGVKCMDSALLVVSILMRDGPQE